jgi:hypothetical protein
MFDWGYIIYEANLEPAFLDILDIKYAEFLFIGQGLSLINEDSGLGIVAAEIDTMVKAELESAELMFGKRHLEKKVFNDLGLKETQLGPKDSLVSGQFA